MGFHHYCAVWPWLLITVSAASTTHFSVFWMISSFVQTGIQVVDSATAMEDAGIVPYLIDSAPDSIAQVEYQSGVFVDNGEELTPTQVKDEPTVGYTADSNKLYTLVMSDPDAPSRTDPIYGEVLHWLVVNIPGNNVSQGETIAEYIGSGPPQDSGLHRYIFLVFEQPGRLKLDEHKISNRSRKGRLNFKVRAFAGKYNLGGPVAGNFYQAQYDDYVPKLREQLSQE